MRLIRKHGSNPKFYFLEISLEFFDLFLLQKKLFQVILFKEILKTPKDTSEEIRTPLGHLRKTKDTSRHLKTS